MDKNNTILDMLLSRAKDSRYYHKVIELSQTKYDIKTYKIGDLNADKLKIFFHTLASKYQNKEIEYIPFNWYENQKKAFIWFMTFYCYQLSAEPSDFIQYDWNNISTIFFNKNPMFLEFQARNMEKNKQRSGWQEQQNNLLRQLVQQYGVKKWNEVSKQMFFKTHRQVFKTPKQCRQRWFNHLDQKVNKEKMSIDEDITIISFVQEHGKKWSEIALILNKTRTQHQVKNRFYALINKQKKKLDTDEDNLLSIVLSQLNRVKEGKSQNKNSQKRKQSKLQKSEEHNSTGKKTLPGIFSFPYTIFTNYSSILREDKGLLQMKKANNQACEDQIESKKMTDQASSMNETFEYNEFKKIEKSIFSGSQFSSFKMYRN